MFALYQLHACAELPVNIASFIISMRPRKFTTDGRMEKRTTASFLPAALPTGLGMIGVVVLVLILVLVL